MCLDILRSPVSALSRARQKKDINKVIMTMLEMGAIFGLAAAVLTSKTTLNATILAGSFLSSFSVFILISAILGWVVKIAAVNLGGKGDYYEGLVAVTYSLVPMAAGLLIISLLFYIPAIGGLLAFFAVFPVLASSLSILYRGIKEMYRTDMIVSYVTVSITLTVFVLAVMFLSGSVMQMMM